MHEKDRKNIIGKKRRNPQLGKGSLWDPLSLPGVPKRTPNFTHRASILLPELGRDSVTTALQHFRAEVLWDVQRMLGAKP